jgi:putative ABC transport system permease protein
MGEDDGDPRAISREGRARGMRGPIRVIEELRQDIAFGLRTLIRNPVLAGTIVMILGLATGATTAIFSVLHSVVLQPLPFREPDRLVEVSLTVPIQELERIRQENTSFERFTFYNPSAKHVRTGAGIERVNTIVSDRDFFSTLGVEALVGRTFRSGDARYVAVISGRFWSRRFNRDPNVIGSVLTLDNDSFTVTGVMPDAFQFPYAAASVIGGALPESRTDVWVAEYRQPVSGRVRTIAARLKPGITAEQAAGEWTVIQNRIDALNPRPVPTRLPDVHVAPLAQAVVGSIQDSLWLIFGAGALVLAAACANVANLLLALTSARVREVATRAALGASRARLARQFLSEGFLLSLAGGAAGLVIARWGSSVLVAFGSAKIPRVQEVALSWDVFAFALMMCVITALLFGLAPALMAAKADVQSVTKESGGHATAARRYGRIRDGLVVAEVALAFVLALGVAVVMDEVRRLRNADIGMTTTNVVALHLSEATTPQSDARPYYQIADRVAQIPGVAAAGFTQALPLQNWGWTANTIDFTRPGRPPIDPPPPFGMELRYVTPGYFQALGIPVVKGRGFSDRDARDAPRVVLINQTLARRYFGDADPLGLDTTRGTIVGVVGDVRQVNLGQPAVPELYYPMAQNWAQLSDLGMSLVVRADRAPEPLVGAIRAAVGEINPNMAIFNVKTMDEVIVDALWELNLYRWLVGLFAGLALALAAVGLYAVISYGVVIRRREWAVRLALGSDPATLTRLVLKRGVRLSAIGIGIGITAAIAGVWSRPNLPVQLTARPATLAAISALLLAIALCASFLPATRAARSTPALALRQD